MIKLDRASLPAHAARLCLIAILTLIAGVASSQTQAPTDNPYYARTNTFSLFSAYSSDSSHIILGTAENRMLLDFGAAYSRKLLLNRIVNWQYNGEILPVALESDPVVHTVTNLTSPVTVTFIENATQSAACIAQSGSYTINTYQGVESGTFVVSCLRRWTIGEAISPAGLQWNLLPRHKLQPFFIAHGGYMYSTQPIPTPEAGSFNFTFDFGAGLELYRSKTRSVRAEYRIHHISNHGTAHDNPGIDNGLFQITYSFGR